MKETLGLTFQAAGIGIFRSQILKIIGRGEVQDTCSDVRDTYQPRKRRKKGREEEKE